MNRVRRCGLILLLAAGFGRCSIDIPASSYQKDARIIDLSSLELEARTPHSLRGPWEFYWNRLIEPQAFQGSEIPQHTAVIDTMVPWTGMVVDGKKLGATGFATYRMKIRFPANAGRLGIWHVHQYSASRLFVDGELTASVGHIGKVPEESIGGRRDTAVFFEPKNRETEFILHVANGIHFQGGLRGDVIVGKEDAVRDFIAQRSIFAVATLGIVLGAAIYHLAFFVMHRTEVSFLLFSLLCFSLALRIPVQLSKVYLLFLSDISWEIVLRYLAFLNVVTIPLGAAFLRSIFPHLISPNYVRFHLAAAAAALLCQLGSLAFISRVNAIYPPIMFAVIVIHGCFVLWRAFRNDEDAVLMGAGLLTLGVLSAFAIVNNSWRGREGAPFAIAGYAAFVLLQSLALSRFFLGAVKARATLTESLHESRLALARQREELQINLHDSLGGALTDLQIYTEQQMAGSAAAQSLPGLHARIADTVKMFRSQLLLMEDLEMTVQELLPGIQMTLLRRYADAGREFDFDVAPNVQELMLQSNLFPVDRASDVFFLVLELCTNDLKYGRGESFWRIHHGGDSLVIAQRNGFTNPAAEGTVVPARATERARKLSGTVHAEIADGEYSVEVRIPLRKK